MDFTLSEERRMLLDTAERFIRDNYPLETRHANATLDDGFNRETWAQFAELGLISALAPAEVGGLGGAGEDVAVVFEALGRGLVVEPFLASGILGAWPLIRAGGGLARRVADIVEGRTLIAFAHGEPEGRYGASHVRTRASDSLEGWRLNGRKSVVLNGDSADWFIVSARVAGDIEDEDGLALFLVSADQVERRGYGGVEGGRAAEVTLNNVAVAPDRVIGAPGAAYGVIEETLARGALALSAEALGLMEVCKEITLDYLKTRKQFGRTLGSFQALQHRMVDMTLEIEQARSAVMLAAGMLEAGPRRTRTHGFRRQEPCRPRGPTGRRGIDPTAWRHRHDLGIRAAAFRETIGDDRPSPRRRRPSLGALPKLHENDGDGVMGRIELSRDGAVLTVVNNDPATRNSLSWDFYEGFREAVEKAGPDPETRAIVLTGAEGFFCSGGNVSGLKERSEAEYAARRKSVDKLHDMIRAMRACPKPIIAAIEGGAAGAGAPLAAACDLIVSAPRRVLLHRLCEDRADAGWRVDGVSGPRPCRAN